MADQPNPSTDAAAALAPVDDSVPATTSITSDAAPVATDAEQDFISLSDVPAAVEPVSLELEPALTNGVNIQALLDQLAAQNASATVPESAPSALPEASGLVVSQADVVAPATVDVLPSVAAHHIHVQSTIPTSSSVPEPAPAPAPAHPTERKDVESTVTASPSVPASAPTNGSSSARGAAAPPASVSQGQALSHPLPSPAFSATARSDDDDSHFTAQMEKDYDDFVREERANVAEGNWEKFPDGSRLFIGNLPTEKVSKRDVFRRFRKYGKLAQISLKQAYGFVQFMDASSCGRARDAEQDRQLKGRKMHLEISRPQKNKTRDRDGRRRSRSPERERGRGDRHSGSGQSFRDRDGRRGRDDYRPGRSPSPIRGHRSNRSVDHYSSRRRSRSITPPRYSDHRPPASDDLPLPFRSPQDIPEIQILVVDELDRQFIAYVEKAFRDRGIRSDVLLLSPRLSESAVIRRQILEGVLGVVRLTRMHQSTGKLSLQLFDQSAGADRVKFEQYEDLEPQITAELVLRARSTHRAPVRDAYQSSSYGLPPSYGLPAAVPAPQAAPSNDVANLLAQLGSRPDLQGILAQLQQPQASNTHNPATTVTPDVARMLAGAVAQQPSAYGQPVQATQPSFDLAALLGSNSASSKTNGSAHPQRAAPVTAPQSAQPAQPDMQQLMAQLANYGGSRR